MKKLLLAGAAMALLTTAASAADLPRRAAPPPVFVPVPVFTWTGFYAGLHSAYAFTDNANIRTTGNALATQANVAAGFRAGSLKSEVDGFAKIGGGMGVNYQLTPGSGFVVGAAFDISWTDLQKNIGFVGAFNAAQGGNNASVYTQNLDYLGTLNGKLGYAFDRFLVYGTGGLAFGNVSYGASFFGTPANGLPLQFIGGYDVNFETGYNYGGGIEYAIPADSFLNTFSVGRLLGLKSDVTMKAEYIRYDLGGRSISVLNAAGGGYTSTFKTEGSLIRAGFNYKFGG
ncbi:outer membrane protein [Methylobacterium haplocladii]|uniref:Porin n=1 Tax=Methylobacterium haplocladii TaxID=1176176 RepID=A0A512IQQ8_9HYPH|nr:porin family protein [Methylobacterium haplocladii]GEP00054.1 porin [Methylobacterium haplocladii]GLS59325.1 porin [Methylobacterium haplocladii]